MFTCLSTKGKESREILKMEMTDEMRCPGDKKDEPSKTVSLAVCEVHVFPDRTEEAKDR